MSTPPLTPAAPPPRASTGAELVPVFQALRAMLAPYAPALVVQHDTASEFYLDTAHVHSNRRPLFFGAVQVKKAAVSYHLMPVYVTPSLLQGMSPALAKRMQGKSCFNFAKVDEALFAELAALTRAGYQSYAAAGFAPALPEGFVPALQAGGA